MSSQTDSIQYSLFKACQSLDKKDTGVLSYAQLTSVLKRHGQEIANLANRIVDSGAQAGKNKVYYEEFISLLYEEDIDSDDDA
jgi:Ca2+-binding EF-hand superfamily protein